MSEPPRVTGTFVGEDVDAVQETMKARGVEFDDPPRYSQRCDVYACFGRGIGNDRFEIQAFRDPAWPKS